jgi:hypothetical protein
VTQPDSGPDRDDDVQDARALVEGIGDLLADAWQSEWKQEARFGAAQAMSNVVVAVAIAFISLATGFYLYVNQQFIQAASE